jgi:hypothetical protein
MGFLGFLKKRGEEKKEAAQGLEVPSPPQLKEPTDIYSELPTFPNTEKKETSLLPPLEPLGAAKKKEAFSIEPFPPITPETTEAEKPVLKEEVKFPEIKFEEAKLEFPEPKFEVEEPKFEIERPAIEETVTSKQPFIKAQNFRAILENINNSVNACRDANKRVAEIHRIDTEKEQRADQWHAAIEAMQRKLVFVDKTLFE